MSWRKLYPFAPHYFTTSEGHRLHYIDENPGSKSCILMLHGNPTWSFMYRNLVRRAAEAGFRAIALDNLGSGLSDKPQDWSYRLENHIGNMEQLLGHLNLPRISIVMHDWGGPMGMGYATRHPEKISSLVLMNTATFLPRDVPKRLYLCHVPLLGPLLVRSLDLLLDTALRRGVASQMPQDVEDGFRAPYKNWHDRIAILKYPLDIPLTTRHPSYNAFKKIEDSLKALADKPVALLWGEKDFCLHTGYLRLWESIYPKAQVHSFPDASHFLLEDKTDAAIDKIIEFLCEHS